MTNAGAEVDVVDTLCQPATVQPLRREAPIEFRALAHDRSILDQVAKVLEQAGVVGVARLVKLLYLAITSRVFERPVSIAIKGPSAAGKSFALEQVLQLFPPRAYYWVTATSERALAYSNEPVAQRMLVLPEAAGMSNDFQSYLIRSLLSEGRIRYETVEKGSEGLRARVIERDGPTGILTTTTRATLHPENETRLLSVTVADTPEQTRAVLRAQAAGVSPAIDARGWHSFQEWIASERAAVHLPYAEQLAELVSAKAVRIRRDFPAVLTLIRAHALLHQATRNRDLAGRIAATFEDYAQVRELVADLVSEGVEATVAPQTRETVEAVRALLSDRPDRTTVMVQDVAAKLTLDKSSASRRCAVAVKQGFLRNNESKKGKPAQLRLGDPFPEEVEVLPTVGRLRSGCTVAGQAAGESGAAEETCCRISGASTPTVVGSPTENVSDAAEAVTLEPSSPGDTQWKRTAE